MAGRIGIIARLGHDERGGEVLEYALVAGLIVLVTVAIVGSAGVKMLARWNSIDSSLQPKRTPPGRSDGPPPRPTPPAAPS